MTSITLTEIIDLINTLNRQGVALTNNPATYDEAFAMHQAALTLTQAHAGILNPDYQALTRANMAYILRRRDNDREQALDILTTAEDILHESSEENTTFFGKGRVWEEKGVILKYNPRPGVYQKADLETSAQCLEEAIRMYEHALENLHPEIVTTTVIKDRKLRTLGLIAVTATELARQSLDEKDRKNYVQKAVLYALQEVREREALGETNSLNLANAYHTLGVAQTESGEFHPELYFQAQENLHHASSVETRPMVRSVLNFRLAWLQYRSSPAEKDAVAVLMRQVLDDQEHTASHWDAGVRNALQPQMEELATYLGGEIEVGICRMYSAK